jgi:hypothetical protein
VPRSLTVHSFALAGNDGRGIPKAAPPPGNGCPRKICAVADAESFKLVDALTFCNLALRWLFLWRECQVGARPRWLGVREASPNQSQLSGGAV